MPYHNPKHKTRQQRQRRRAGRVRRLEVTLSADSQRDHDISDFLDSIPLGSTAEFIRSAIAEKIQRETASPEPEAQPVTTAPSDQIDQLFAELDHQRREANEQIAALYQELADEKHHASRQLEAMIAELAELRQAMRQPASTATTTYQDRPAVPPALPESSETVRASGIDMSRPRPRPTARSVPAAVEQPVEKLSDQDAIRLAKIMANSIKRAQPGKG